MINGIQMDSCAVLDAASSMGSGILKEQFGIGAKKGSENAFNEYITSVNDSLDSFEKTAKSYLKGFLCAAGGGTDCPIKWLDPDYVDEHDATLLSTMLYKNTMLKGMGLVEEDEDTDIERLIRGFVGDIIYSPGQTDGGVESQPTTKYIPPSFSATYGTLKDALDIWIGKKNGTTYQFRYI
jgi:hypothetical protein